jgi:uncharacterized protein (TIGR00730 family)
VRVCVFAGSAVGSSPAFAAALPGGTGTLDELFEVVTWRQLGLHAKPIGLLDVEGYWQPLLAFLRHGVEQGLIPRAVVAALPVSGGAEALLDAIERG